MGPFRKLPLDDPGVEIQPVYTFMDERTNITFYDNVRIPDSWRLGEVDGGLKTMSASLELEHGGGFGKYMRKMLEAGEAACREITRNDHLSEDTARKIDAEVFRIISNSNHQIN